MFILIIFTHILKNNGLFPFFFVEGFLLILVFFDGS